MLNGTLPAEERHGPAPSAGARKHFWGLTAGRAAGPALVRYPVGGAPADASGADPPRTGRAALRWPAPQPCGRARDCRLATAPARRGGGRHPGGGGCCSLGSPSRRSQYAAVAEVAQVRKLDRRQLGLQVGLDGALAVRGALSGCRERCLRAEPESTTRDCHADDRTAGSGRRPPDGMTVCVGIGAACPTSAAGQSRCTA